MTPVRLPTGDVDLVSRPGRDPALQRIVPEDRLHVSAAGAVVVDAGPVPGEGAAADLRAGPLEHRHRTRAVLRVILAAGKQPDVVHAEIRDVADEQAVVEGGAAAVQEVERRAGHLRAVVAEDAVAEHRGVERPAEVLDGYTGAAWAGVIADHLDALDGRIGARIDLDAAAIEIQERRLGHLIGFDWRALAGAGGVVLRAGDAETAQHGLRRYAVAEIDDVIDDRREAWRLIIGDRRIGGGQHHLADRFERDAICPAWPCCESVGHLPLSIHCRLVSRWPAVRSKLCGIPLPHVGARQRQVTPKRPGSGWIAIGEVVRRAGWEDEVPDAKVR